MTDLFAQNAREALAWTLIHGLWQGTLIALALSLLAAGMNRTSARARYLVLASGLPLMLLAALFTYANEIRGGATPVLDLPEASLGAMSPLWINLLCLFWVGGVAVFALRFAGGYLYAHRLAAQARPLSQSWQRRLATLAQRLGVQRVIRLAESHKVNVPMVIGHVKPVIVIPVGMLSHLSRAELEAVLLHELGHIARADYLLNLMQSLIEVLFFYHPAVWWLGAQMRAEREHCCDDLAVAVTHDPVTFAKALTRVAEWSPRPLQPAMAAAGRGSLRHRVQRLVSPDQRSGLPFRLGGGLLMLSLLLVMGLVNADHSDEKPTAETTQANGPELHVEEPDSLDEERQALMQENQRLRVALLELQVAAKKRQMEAQMRLRKEEKALAEQKVALEQLRQQEEELVSDVIKRRQELEKLEYLRLKKLEEIALHQESVLRERELRDAELLAKRTRGLEARLRQEREAQRQ